MQLDGDLLDQHAKLESTIAELPQIKKSAPERVPSGAHMTFAPIFQLASPPGRNPNFGPKPYVRHSCFGLPGRGGGATWPDLLEQFAMAIVTDYGLLQLLTERICVLENSILLTDAGAVPQVGHFDLQVRAPPCATVAPCAMILVTPLDRDSSLRILPMGNHSISQPLPTSAEFEQYAVTVPVRVGEALLMRFDISHSGSSAEGLRAHTVLGPTDMLGHELGSTHHLQDTY